MYYVPCKLIGDKREYYYKVKDIRDMFSVNHLMKDNKKIKISQRGIPDNYIDMFISKKFFQKNIFEGVV